MNIQQMKAAIKKFRSANVSIIKDDALRTKAQTLQAKQKGFTLLELLIVITILATLATAALVAYDGIGENASDTAVANNLISAESAIRNYRAIENVYPNQWDNLANVNSAFLTVDASGAGLSGTVGGLLAQETLDFFGNWAIDSADSSGVLIKVASALNAVGIDELQTIDSSVAFNPGTIIPNLAFNESNGITKASELELEEDGGTLSVVFDDGDTATPANIGLSIVPAGGDGTTCTAGTIDLRKTFSGITLPDSQALNLINDHFDDDGCTLVLALGYGKDVPGTTVGSRVAIAQVPTLGTTKINPAEKYARAIALFQVGVDENEDGDITKDEIFAKARLMGVVDPEGRAIDSALAAANATN